MRFIIRNAVALSCGALLGSSCMAEAPDVAEEAAGGDSAGAVDPSAEDESAEPALDEPSNGTSPSPSTSEVRPNPTLLPAAQAQDPQTAPSSQGSGAETPPPTSGAIAPRIPAVSGDCPEFRSSTITFAGLGGIQLVVGPKAAAATAPMVLYWHGTGSRASEFTRLAGAVRDGVEAEGGILVSFQGTTGGDALSGTSIFGRGDIDLVDQLVACAVRDHNIDARRIFTTGCSAGGLFATNLAMLRSEYIAAAAPNSGGLTFPQEFQSNFTPALMTVHGAPGRDRVVVDFSNTSATADRAFKDRGGFVINCNHGGGHCGGAALAPDIWEFFEAHPYGVEPEPSPWAASGLPSGFSSECQVF